MLYYKIIIKYVTSEKMQLVRLNLIGSNTAYYNEATLCSVSCISY